MARRASRDGSDAVTAAPTGTSPDLRCRRRHDPATPPPVRRRSATSSKPVPATVSARGAVVTLAEREVTDLSRHIAQLEARVGMLRHQRENLMNWILREPKVRNQQRGTGVGRSDVSSGRVDGSHA